MVRRKARTRFCSQLQTLVAGYESYYYYYSVSKAYLKRISSVSQALIRRWQSSQPPAKSVAGSAESCALMSVVAKQAAAVQQSLEVERIRQHPGQQQVSRAVKVSVPGKHFPQLEAAEQKIDYDGTAVEYAERHKFAVHRKAWGNAHVGEGIRFVCTADAIDDPDDKGHWTTLALWNRWRHNTYKDRRDDELQYLDELPAAGAAARAAVAQEKAEPEVKKFFTVVSQGVHTYGGGGRLSGQTAVSYNYACKKDGCTRGPNKPIKQVGASTGQLFIHLKSCQPEVCRQLRAHSKYSPLHIDDDGNEYSLYSFDELLPHHARFVERCFRGLDHFYETRADTGLREYVQGYNPRASLPCEKTCKHLLEVRAPTVPLPCAHSPCTISPSHPPHADVRGAGRPEGLPAHADAEGKVWGAVCGLDERHLVVGQLP
jgi:hypothetical protein